MNKILLATALLTFPTLATAELLPWNDRISLYTESISVLKNPKRVNYTVKFLTDEGYSKINSTILCHNQTEYITSMRNFDHSDNYIDSFNDKNSIGKENATDIEKNSLSDPIYKSYCLK